MAWEVGLGAGHVVTVLGPRPADGLGVVDGHDHLLVDSPGLPGQGVTDPAPPHAREGAIDGALLGSAEAGDAAVAR
jgi:hypothetical protein